MGQLQRIQDYEKVKITTTTIVIDGVLYYVGEKDKGARTAETFEELTSAIVKANAQLGKEDKKAVELLRSQLDNFINTLEIVGIH